MAVCKRGMLLLLVLHSVRTRSILSLFHEWCDRHRVYSLANERVVKALCRLNFNLHGEGFYCCCWFTGVKCLASSGIFRLLRGLFVPERSETRSKIFSVLVRSASPENRTKGECKPCDSKTVLLGNACLRCGWQHAGFAASNGSLRASATLISFSRWMYGCRVRLRNKAL